MNTQVNLYVLPALLRPAAETETIGDRHIHTDGGIKPSCSRHR